MKLLFENWKRFLMEHSEEDSDLVSKVIISNENNEVLLLKRAPNAPKYPNYWDLPGGHAKKGEDLIKAGVRETKEETGLSIKGLKQVKKYKKINFFKTKEYSGSILDTLPEHSEYKWVNIDDLNQHRLPPGGNEAVKEVLGELTEDFQDDVKKKHLKLKKKTIGMGGNREKVPKSMNFMSAKRAKSSPPGFGGT